MFFTVMEALKGHTQGLSKNAKLQATVNCSCSLPFLILTINAKPFQNSMLNLCGMEISKMPCQAAGFLLHIYLKISSKL
jgi:hypothetical protein